MPNAIMGQIGRFIDRACRDHPALMRRVLDRPFGDLHAWVNFDEEGEACGCLVGTMALCAGLHADDFRDEEDLECEQDDAAIALVDDLMRRQPWQPDQTYDVGMAVSGMADRLGTMIRPRSRFSFGSRWQCTPESDARTAELIKRRIARRLRITPAPQKAAAVAAA